jgi:hypothetical protein
VKAAVLFLSLFTVRPDGRADDAKSPASRLPAGCEVVMSPGMRITATTAVGTIAITAVDELTRSYTWEGATRAVEMCPREGRYYGSLGLSYSGMGVHWRDHHGIQRCFTEEGQQHFQTLERAMNWIKKRGPMPFVYRDDGLMVKNSSGMTPLMIAAMDGSEDLVRLLLDHGADVNAKTPDGLTALSWAKLVWSEGLEGGKDRRGVIRVLEAAAAQN